MRQTLTLFFLYLSCISFGQEYISGTIIDGLTKETLIGANVIEINTKNGTTSDYIGKFTLNVNKIPTNIQVTYLGYQSTHINIKDNNPTTIELFTENNKLTKVDIVDTRITKKQKEAALTVETLDMISIRETPSSNFYDGLGALKGVDVTAASLGFKVINTRGFNSTSPVRSLQIIDGVDNQSPGLNFSLGNFLGSSELDIQKVEIIQGASSAYYGPNAFNGVINMQTKDPFIHPGLSIQYKFGSRQLFENSIRLAEKLQNKKGENIFAYKINLYYMQAQDWEANNMNAVDGTINRNNPGGYDAINRYGDEDTDGNLNDVSDNFNLNYLTYPGLGKFHRTGYLERDIVDYNTNNFKTQTSLHYMIKPKVELIYALNYSTGTTVYQGDNRFSLKNIQFWQNRIEIRQKEKFFIRAYRTQEDAGNSYDAVFTAFKLQEYNYTTNQQWYTSYKNNWRDSFQWEDVEWENAEYDFINQQWNFQGNSIDINEWIELSDSVLNANYELIISNHNSIRNLTDLESNRLIPGTEEFNNALEDITSKTSYLYGGTGFYDKSALNHIHAEYNFTGMEDNMNTILKIGTNFRNYLPNTQGSLFMDTASIITNNEIGLYSGIESKILGNLIKINATIRADKNENFDLNFSPAASIVYKPTNKDVIRVSFSSAIRNPTLADQYLFYNVGRAILIGNLYGHGTNYGENLVSVESLVNYYLPATPSKDSLKFFTVKPIQPEKAKSCEIGYRSNFFNKIYLDINYYYSQYQDFIGYQIGAKFDTIGNIDPNAYEIALSSVQVYRMAANAQSTVTTQGASVGVNYYMSQKITLNCNYSWNKLNKKNTEDPIIPAYNTPEHKYNIGIVYRDMHFSQTKNTLRDFSFSMNYKWVQEFLFEGSPQFTGIVPSYDILDMQISKKIRPINAILKIGSSNLLNNIHYEVYGGPYIGRMTYASILFDIK